MRTSSQISLILVIFFLLFPLASASDFCAPTPNDINVVYTHEGNWFNFTLTSPTSYNCVDNGAMMGDVVCTPNTPAQFTANATCGIVPFSVMFSNATIPGIIGTAWDFGNGSTSTDVHPVMNYTTPGVYPVNFGINYGSPGWMWNNKSAYIVARAVGDTCNSGTAPVKNTGEHWGIAIVLATMGVCGFFFYMKNRKRGNRFI